MHGATRERARQRRRLGARSRCYRFVDGDDQVVEAHIARVNDSGDFVGTRLVVAELA